MTSYDVPILVILFNRPDTAQRVFDEIKKIKPKKLFFAADGARTHVAGEYERCEETKKIISQVDWDCEVQTLFQEKNLGLLYGPATAIDWFFDHVEEGIIFEHDCVPHQSFFDFSKKMLEKYRHDTRVMHIGGSNFQDGRKIGDGSYYFSRFNHVWGWATWKRAWKYFDPEMKTFPKFVEQNTIASVWSEKNKAKVFLKTFNKIYQKQIGLWDYVWTYTVWSQNGLTILPNVNLISNIGFGPQATNTQKKTEYMDLPTEGMGDIVDPTFVAPSNTADNYVFNKIFKAKLRDRIVHKVKTIFKKRYVKT